VGTPDRKWVHLVTGSRPVLVVAGRHRPHEIAFLLFSLMVGVAFTLGTAPPQSVAATMPEVTVRVWAIGLLVSGVVGLAAVLPPLDVRLSLQLEAGAMLIGAGALLVVTVAVFNYAGLRGLFGGGFCAAWLAANLVRAVQIHRDLRNIHG